MKVGDQLPVFERLLDLPRMVAYAGATWDWNRLHYDTAYAAARHLPAPVVDGQMFGALMAEQAMAAGGPGAFPMGMHFRFKSPVFAGDTVRIEATVTEIEPVAADGPPWFVTIEQRVLAGDRVAATGWTKVRTRDNEETPWTSH